MVVHLEKLVGGTHAGIGSPESESMTPVEIGEKSLLLAIVHECADVSHGLVSRHFMHIHDGVVDVSISQHTLEVLSLGRVGEPIGEMLVSDACRPTPLAC